MRRLLPAAILLPPILDWLRLQGQASGLYGGDVGIVLVVFLNIVIFSLLIWRSAAGMNRLEEERKESEGSLARLAAIVEYSDDAIIGKTLGGIITSWNKGAEKIFLYTAEEMIGKAMQLLIPPERIDEEPEILRKIAHGESIDHFETVRVRKDGTRIHVSTAISPIKDHRGTIIGASNITRDITARKQSEEQIHFLANLISNVTDAIIATDMNQTIQSWNSGAETMYGWKAEEVIGRQAKDILQTDFLEATRDTVTKQILETGHWSGEVVHVRQNGTKVPALSSVSIYKNSEGKPAGIVAVNRDITRRKQAEEEKTKLLERLAFLLEASELLSESLDFSTRLKRVAEISVPRIADWCAVDLLRDDDILERVAVVHTDPAKIQFAYELQQRYPPDTSEPRGVYEVMRTGKPELYPEIPDKMLEAAAKDEEHLLLMRKLGLKSGLIVPLLVHGKVKGVITFVAAESGRRFTQEDLRLAEDLARRAAVSIENARLYVEMNRLNEDLEQRVKERTAQLEKANKELEAFSYSVSHDLRAPLRHIDGFADLLNKHASTNGGLDETSRHYLSVISESAKHMGILIDDLLVFSRMGRVEMRTTAVPLELLVKGIIAETSRESEGRNVEWKIESLPEVHGDPAMLRLALQNLIGNAIKYTRPREKAIIHIGSKMEHGAGDGKEKNEIVVFVHDNGVGFDMRYADKLFGVFQRLHRSEDFEGTGVGLANVRRIIERHGGRTWAEGEVDKGATFYFSLPE